MIVIYRRYFTMGLLSAADDVMMQINSLLNCPGCLLTKPLAITIINVS